MITFQVEKWSDCVADMRPLWPEHYEALSADKDIIKLECDEEKYRQGEASGNLHIVTARADGNLVGYYYGILIGHLHYKSAGLMCWTDAYWMTPKYRGVNGVRFMSAIIKSVKNAGAVKLYISTKVTNPEHDLTKFLQLMGFRHTDNLLTCLL